MFNFEGVLLNLLISIRLVKKHNETFIFLKNDEALY